MFVWPLIAVVVILAAVRVFGTRAVPRFEDPGALRALAAVEHPDVAIEEAVITLDGRGGLAGGTSSPWILGFTCGNQQSTRLLAGGDLRGIEVTEGAQEVRAMLHLHDVGFPHAELRLSRDHWSRWGPRLQSLVGAVLCLVTSVSAQAPVGACLPGWGVITDPGAPRQGTFFVVRVRGVPSGAQLAGRIGSEPLHFSPVRGDPRGATALAGVAIDADLEQVVEVRCERGDARDTVRVPLRLTSGRWPTERLRVAPQFAAPPDSALAARIARESARAAEVARLSHATPRLWSDRFQRPRPGRVTSGYGRGREFNGMLQSRHMGTDFAGAVGAPVRAVNRGVVRLVDAFYYGGNVVYVDHGDGLTTAYLHLSRTRVAVGDTVTRGQVLGDVGATGRVTGPHLHLIARYGTASLDAASLLRLVGVDSLSPVP